MTLSPTPELLALTSVSSGIGVTIGIMAAYFYVTVRDFRRRVTWEDGVSIWTRARYAARHVKDATKWYNVPKAIVLLFVIGAVASAVLFLLLAGVHATFITFG